MDGSDNSRRCDGVDLVTSDLSAAHPSVKYAIHLFIKPKFRQFLRQ